MAQGWINDPELRNEIIQSLQTPFFAQAADVLIRSGEKKRALLYNNFKKLNISFPAPIQADVGDCVAHATSLAGDTLAVTEIVNGDREQWIARSANEYFYHVSRVIIGKNRLRGGDGSINGWAAKGFAEYGSLRRIKYDSIDLTNYSSSRSRKWGESLIPNDLYNIAKSNNIQKFAIVRSFEEACDSLINGYPIIVASNQGFTSYRDKDGFALPKGTWNHSMGVLGFKDDDNRPGVVIANSWPNYLAGKNEFDLPPSAFWCDAEVFNKMCKFNDTYALSGFAGFKLKPNARII